MSETMEFDEVMRDSTEMFPDISTIFETVEEDVQEDGTDVQERAGPSKHGPKPPEEFEFSPLNTEIITVFNIESENKYRYYIDEAIRSQNNIEAWTVYPSSVADGQISYPSSPKYVVSPRINHDVENVQTSVTSHRVHSETKTDTIRDFNPIVMADNRSHTIPVLIPTYTFYQHYQCNCRHYRFCW